MPRPVATAIHRDTQESCENLSSSAGEIANITCRGVKAHQFLVCLSCDRADDAVFILETFFCRQSGHRVFLLFRHAL